MQLRIDPSQLAATVMHELAAFAGATNEVLDHAANVAARHAVSDLDIHSPHLTNDYRKGWKVKKGKRASVGGVCQVIVHNRTDYQLTHLLEYGHVKVYYGHRLKGRVAAKVHIKPVEEATIAEFEALVRQGVAKK